MPSVEIAERELPLIQRGIVDNCFEEGHYEYGIDVLDKLRGERYKPSPLHVRQLLYIALYPPPPKPAKRINRADAPPPSPHKVQLQRQKDDLWPKPASRPLAISLLEAFARTNAPASLMRGLPFYSYVSNEGVMDVDPFSGEKNMNVHVVEDNSPLKNEVLIIQQLKDCWEFLRGGFVKRKQTDRSRVDEADVDLEGEEYDVLGPYAWPVLEWLIHVFEKDERQAGEDGKAPHSALLLCQIPPPKTKKGPRWDVEAALNVVFACLSPDPRTVDRLYKYASPEKRFELGKRLLSLLVNLTLTKPPLLSSSHLLRPIDAGVLDLPLSFLDAFLSAIPSSQAFFKISLLERYLSQSNGSSVNNKGNSGPPVAPRAKPKPTRSAGPMGAPSSTGATGAQDKDPYPLANIESLLKLLSSPLPLSPAPKSHDSVLASPPPQPSSSTSKIALAKFHLISTLCTLQLSRRLVGSQWATAAREGKLRKCVLDGFVRARGVDDMLGDGMGDIDARDLERFMTGALQAVTIWEAASG